MRVLAIDPGETCGLATLRVEREQIDVSSYSDIPGTVFADGAPIVKVGEVASVPPGIVYTYIESGEFDAVVSEEWRLYPWLMQTQIFSELLTVKVIGVIEYLSALHELPFYSQRTDIKKEARHLGQTHGMAMRDRTLGSGKGKYRGPDFDYPGQQHGRDAVAHGIHWAYRNKNSPAYER